MVRPVTKNYYEIINVSRTATIEEIKKAYKKQALKVHPDKNTEAGAEDRFKELQEAFSTLSDPAKRRSYDSTSRFTGLNDLFNSAYSSRSRYSGPAYSAPDNNDFDEDDYQDYHSTNRFEAFNTGGAGCRPNGGKRRSPNGNPRSFYGNPWQSGGSGTNWASGGFAGRGRPDASANFWRNNYSQYYGTARDTPPWSSSSAKASSTTGPQTQKTPSRPSSSNSNSDSWRQPGKENKPPPPPPPPPPSPPPPPPPKQDPPVVYELKVAMWELLSGNSRHITINREVLQANGFLNTEREVLEVKVEPGWKQGTKITFPRRGDVFPGRLPADIVFLIKETEHPIFRRDGADLKCEVEVPLCDALCGTASVPSLDDPPPDGLLVNLQKPIIPGTAHRIPSKGLPDRKRDCQRGDLVVTFAVRFPDSVTDNVLAAAQHLTGKGVTQQPEEQEENNNDSKQCNGNCKCGGKPAASKLEDNKKNKTEAKKKPSTPLKQQQQQTPTAPPPQQSPKQPQMAPRNKSAEKKEKSEKSAKKVPSGKEAEEQKFDKENETMAEKPTTTEMAETAKTAEKTAAE